MTEDPNVDSVFAAIAKAWPEKGMAWRIKAVAVAVSYALLNGLAYAVSIAIVFGMFAAFFALCGLAVRVFLVTAGFA